MTQMYMFGTKVGWLKLAINHHSQLLANIKFT
uniref:Uncharacterized protein n=1 Tax=Arundo donax TaxID=35708 RepID=A0A0A9E6P5_ARUDO